MKECKVFFQKEIENVVRTLENQKEGVDLTFALVADSHLDDFEEDTLANIKAVDHNIAFDFIVHLGDFLNGNIPRGYTRKILIEEMNKYRFATASGILYPVQGNHDGFYFMGTENKKTDIALDDEWYAATSFTADYKHLVRDAMAPYFYVDYPEKKIRLIILCSFSYEIQENKKYQKSYKMDPEQLGWLEKKAMVLDADWTVVLFSHSGVLNYYDETMYDKEPWLGNRKDLMETVLSARKQYGFSIAAWFCGHSHGEVCKTIQGIPFVEIGSQTCYVPQLWRMPKTGHFEVRERGSVTQDLWDAVTLNKVKREVYLCRFGAGSDRVIHY